MTSFATDIKPLFRDQDVQSMAFRFHLDRYEDVSKHADHILKRLRAGEMPCDGAWPTEKVELFASWVSGGKQR